jgi:hypothetical protein
MKLTILFFILFLTLSVSAYGRQEPGSRFGVLEIKDDESRSTHQLLLNGKVLLQYSGQSIKVRRVLKGRGRDYAIVATYSGGIACPARVVIVEIYQGGRHRKSEEFGSCSDLIKARLISGRVIVETPTYTPHPEMLSKKELRKSLTTKEVYTWDRGRLSEKTISSRAHANVRRLN